MVQRRSIRPRNDQETDMATATARVIDWTEQGRVPDPVIRHGIRRLLRERLAELPVSDCEAAGAATARFIEDMRASDIALLADKANDQHYEVPAEFFSEVLGGQLKYSCCYWGEATQTLDEAERLALELTCLRAGIEDGMDVLELGCGWGALSLWMAQRYPASRITAVSNSRSQGLHIRTEAARLGVDNISVVTSDMNGFQTDARYDRVVSVEMFEHMRNHPVLFERIHDWLRPGGRFFMHIFCHRSVPYAFQDRGAADWMSRYFFSGGMMPSDDLPLYFQQHLRLLQRWRWSGRHYERTANAWLANMDAGRERLMPVLERVYGAGDAHRWWMRWRMFFMACAELFGYEAGQQWWVSHYLFERPAATAGGH
jgi:cyclopropane-fatty-acyl-phospholipid synthase